MKLVFFSVDTSIFLKLLIIKIKLKKTILLTQKIVYI